MPQSNIYLNHNYSPQLCEIFGNHEIKQHIMEDDETFKLFQQRYYSYHNRSAIWPVTFLSINPKNISWKYEGNFVALLFWCSFGSECVTFRIKPKT